MKSIIYFFLLYATYTFGQFDVPLTLRNQFNGQFGYTIIGNTLNAFDNWQIPNPPCELLTSSTAVLNLNSNQTIVGSYLYWSGIGNGTFNPVIQLNGSNIVANNTYIGNPEPFPEVTCFGSFKDITAFVQNTGNGQYVFSGLDLNPIKTPWCSTSEYYAGWAIVVVYSESTLPNVQLNIYDGFNVASQFFNSGITPLTINNLFVANTSDAKMSYIAYRGSTNLFGNEYITFNGNILSNSQNPANNPFNSTNSFTGSNTLWNMDIDTFDISPYVNVGNTSANIIFASGFTRFLQTVVTSIRSELPDATVALTQVTGQNTCNNRNLQVNYTVQNTNSNGNLPANIPVSFYANNVLLSTVLTPSPIAIGGVLPLQTSVSIPLSIANTFNLRVVVDNAVAVTSTIAESNENNNEASQSVTLIGNNVAPVFALPTTFCAGDVVPVLPLVSTNGISGNWSPSVINNQTSGSYTFLPAAAGTCASPFTLNVVINNVVPTFSIPTTFCQGATVPVLPLVSNNGIVGSWLPNVISNQNSGSYVFAPNVGTCGLPFTLNVTISPAVNPTFSIPNTFCQGANVPVLPLISSNNIAGTWLPNVISNQNSGSYVFLPAAAGTPNAGTCATAFTLNIVLTPNVLPTFSLPNLLCQNATVPILPLVSNNGISGTWSPSVINNQASGSYIFLPASAGTCATSFTLNIAIQTQTVTTSNVLICNDAQGNNIRPVDLNSGLNPNNFSFAWTKDGQVLSQTSSSILVSTIGNYELVALPNGLNCPQIYRFVVTALTPITANFIVSDDFASNQTIKVEASGGSGQYQYSFDNLPFQSNPIFSVLDGGDILVKVRDDNHCYSISKTLTLWQYPRFFTPNGDGFNDTWAIKSQKKITIDIFNRFGKLLQQLKTGESWNGTFNTQPLPADDYWFAVYYDNKIFKGHFSLKR